MKWIKWVSLKILPYTLFIHRFAQVWKKSTQEPITTEISEIFTLSFQKQPQSWLQNWQKQKTATSILKTSSAMTGIQVISSTMQTPKIKTATTTTAA